MRHIIILALLVWLSPSLAYDFRYVDGADTVTYRYVPASNGNLGALKCVINGRGEFQPASSGGLWFKAHGTAYTPWDGSVTYRVLSTDSSASGVTVSWRAKFGADSMDYAYHFSLAEKTLKIHVTSADPHCPIFTLDRSDLSTAPVIVRVPYLTLFSALYSNGMFTSFYTDWETSHATRIGPSDGVFSPASVYYTQTLYYDPNTFGVRQTLDETLLLTTASTLPEVLPTLVNPVSPKRAESASRVVLDGWQSTFHDRAASTRNLHARGASSLWVIQHVWQNGGYDNKYPDVLPANQDLGGDDSLTALGSALASLGDLFAVHENYVDMYQNAASWNAADIAKDSVGGMRLGWLNTYTGIQSYQVKPSKAAAYQAIFSPQLHSRYNTTSTFLDVHSSANPSDKVDLDAQVPNGNRFTETLRLYRELGGLLRTAHAGPVSGEGYMHFLYLGWFDDVEAQINTGAGGAAQGSTWPLLVDFDLLHLHGLAAVHGVGYYERFFASGYSPVPRDSVLTYIATEIAYGHSGFIPDSTRLLNFQEAALLECRLVLPAQAKYALANATRIRYNDNGELVDASTYIRRHPATYAQTNSADFMGQVRVDYDNGTIVFVNRSLSKTWAVDSAATGEWTSFHATVGSVDSLGARVQGLLQFTLPVRNGWLVFSPNAPSASKPGKQGTLQQMRRKEAAGYRLNGRRIPDRSVE